MSKIVALQEQLRPALAPVFGCKDYNDEKRLLERVDRILNCSGVERLFLELSMENFDAKAAELKAAGERVLDGAEALVRYQRHSREALRCTVLKNLVGESYREMSKALAMTPLYRWFCGLEDFEAIRVPGKSTLQDYAHWLSQAQMEQVLETLTRAVADEDRAREIGLESELDTEIAWVDTTCLKACIHFPIDWVLMRDAVRTLVEEHARRYRNELDERWSQSDLSRKEAEVILRRMDNVLEQLPEARRQAHERIIGERQVANAKKILSLYESDVHVVVRGKAGADVEFGNSLFLAETREGFILDHELKCKRSAGDAKWLQSRYARMKQESGGRLRGIVADRGFESAATREMLQEENAFNGICPMNPTELAQRMEADEQLRSALSRRAQTEARVAILKNGFLDGAPLAKGFERRQLQVAWAVLSHNLWVLARLPWAAERRSGAESAA